MTQTNRISIQEKWQKIAEATRDEASTLPPCPERDNLLKKARQLDVALKLNDWLSPDSATHK